MLKVKSIRNLSVRGYAAICLVLTTGTSLAVVDQTFDLGINTIGDEVSTIVIDDQERIVFAGSFSEVAQEPRSNIARVTASGELDPNFSPTIDGPVHSVVKMQSGRLLIVGSFESVSGLPRQGIAILNEDGGVDASFAPEFGEREVTHAIVQSDDKIVAVVGLQPYLDNSNACCQSVINPQRLLRLNPDGTEDVSFNSDSLLGSATAITVLGDDGLVLSHIQAVGSSVGAVLHGEYSHVLGHSVLEKFDSKGGSENKVDITSHVNRFLVTEVDKFIAAGCIGRIGFEYTDCDRNGCQTSGGVLRLGLARFENNLSVDLSFNANNDFVGTWACLLDIAQDSRSEFIVVGNRDLQGIFGRERTYAKVSSIGNKYADFDLGVTPFGATAVEVQSDDKILIGRKVFNKFGYELVDGIIRVFEEPSTCFPIKAVTGNVSMFCL